MIFFEGRKTIVLRTNCPIIYLLYLKDWNWLENVTAELWRPGVNIHTLMWWTIELILRPRYEFNRSEIKCNSFTLKSPTC